MISKNKWYVIFFLFLSVFIYLSCTNENVRIKLIWDSGIEDVEVSSRIEKLKISGNKSNDILKVEGLDRLKKLKYLKIGCCVQDLSFLKDITGLKVLIINSALNPIEGNILSSLSKLETAEIDGANINGYFIDLNNNEVLENLILSNIHPTKGNSYNDFKIINLPKSLKMIDMSAMYFDNISGDLIQSILFVEKIILPLKFKNDPDVMEYTIDHKNILFGSKNNKLLESGYLYNLFDN